ncbi:XF1762 family protein [Kitasatospora sp. LaBMicrA B282]|uniref:XF1762 family protein n=1 Tax=Kitasatospora sp. LaBMicrA B282 TaxID=3420949 RepID=UPI003D0D9C3F
MRPLDFRTACRFIDPHHRHHRAPRGHRFSLGLTLECGLLVAVAIAGRPVARALDDELTIEVTRLAGDGTPNACSALYGAVWRTARAAGFRRAITYTQDPEPCTSLRAAGWHLAAVRRARAGWDTPSRPRQRPTLERIGRRRWETTTGDASRLPALLRSCAARQRRSRAPAVPLPDWAVLRQALCRRTRRVAQRRPPTMRWTPCRDSRLARPPVAASRAPHPCGGPGGPPPLEPTSGGRLRLQDSESLAGS